MKNKFKLAGAVAIVFAAIGILAERADAAVTILINITSSTTIDITASGTLEGAVPSINNNTLWIDTPVGSPPITLVGSGLFQVGAQSVEHVFVGFENRPYSSPIQFRFISDMNIGDVVNFNGTLSSEVAHNLTNSDLINANIYWGRNSEMDSPITAGSFQGQASTVPEPSSALMLACALGFAALCCRNK